MLKFCKIRNWISIVSLFSFIFFSCRNEEVKDCSNYEQNYFHISSKEKLTFEKIEIYKMNKDSSFQSQNFSLREINSDDYIIELDFDFNGLYKIKVSNYMEILLDSIKIDLRPQRSMFNDEKGCTIVSYRLNGVTRKSKYLKIRLDSNNRLNTLRD